jgi:UDP-N-acetylmuramyl pentapeptide synthase
VIDLSAAKLAAAAGGELVAGDPDRAGPARAVIDSREVEPGDLFVGLPGAGAHGGEFAVDALDAGAWGVIVGWEHSSAAMAAAVDTVGHSACAGAAVIAVKEPLAALQALAR